MPQRSLAALSQAEFWVEGGNLTHEAELWSGKGIGFGVGVVERQPCVQILALVLILGLKFSKSQFPYEIRIKVSCQDVLEISKIIFIRYPAESLAS